MMHKTLKKNWLKALRSRKYKQGQGRLRIDGPEQVAYCCLGVLCEVAGIKYNPNAVTPSKNFRIGEEDIYRLIEMNDKDDRKFYQIARWIERNL